MQSSSNANSVEVQDLYRPQGRHETILSNELNDENSVISITPESTHGLCSLEMVIASDNINPETGYQLTEYSNAEHSVKEYIKCRDALEETLTLLTGSDDDDKRKSCTKLVAAVFVLSHVVHEFSVLVTRQQQQPKAQASTSRQNPSINPLTPVEHNNANSIRDDEHAKLINQTSEIIISLEELVKELQKLEHNAESFRKSVSYAYRFCADVQRQGNSEWNGERLIIPKSNDYFHSKNRTLTRQFDEEHLETQWLLLIQSKTLLNNYSGDPAQMMSKSKFNLFSSKSVSTKMTMLVELIKKTRFLIALAHSQLILAKRTFSTASATKLFHSSKNLLSKSNHRSRRSRRANRETSWTIITVQKLFPTTRSLITLINSICEIIQPAETISNLTFVFLSKMHGIAIKKTNSSIVGNRRNWFGEIMSKYFCFKLCSQISTSKTWFKIELMLNSFADSLSIEEITLLMEKDCLVLGRNCRLTSSGYLTSSTPKNELKSKLEDKEKSLSKESLRNELGLIHSTDNNNARSIAIDNLMVSDNVPVDPYDSQLPHGNDSEEFTRNEEIYLPEHLVNPDNIFLAAGEEPHIPASRIVDQEGNFDAMSNPNFLGPILIEVDMEGCPPIPLEEVERQIRQDENINVISPGRNQEDILVPSKEKEISSINLVLSTLNFIFLLYNWWQRFAPNILIKLQGKVNEKLKQNKFKIIGEEDAGTGTSPIKVLESVKNGKSVTIHVPPQQDDSKKESSTIIHWKESKRNHFRKSSIPFADRAPRVRFNRVETCITSLKEGPHKPIIGGTDEEQQIISKMKPILKKTEHPILVDMTSMSVASTPKLKTLSNDELVVCVSIIERIIGQLAKAERQIRGVFDILSFPSARLDFILLFSRFKASLMISTDLMEKIATAEKEHEQHYDSNNTDGNNTPKTDGMGDTPSRSIPVQAVSSNSNLQRRRQHHQTHIINSKEMLHVTGLTESLLTKINSCSTYAKKFLAANRKLNSQWEVILRKKGEFHVPVKKGGCINQAIYPQEIMPENVTLYENVVDSPYPMEGNLTIMWSANDVKINTDIDSTPIDWNSSKIEEKFEILDTILSHGHELLKYALVQIKIAVESLSDASLKAGYDNIKSRIVDIECDATWFDPLVSLELKNILAEFVVRKCELLNLAEKLSEQIDWSHNMIEALNTYCNQLLLGDEKGDRKYRGLMCGLCASYKFVSIQDLFNKFNSINNLTNADMWISIPMPIEIQMTMQKLQNVANMKKQNRRQDKRKSD